MATKRTHAAMEGVHPSRQAQVPGSTKPSKKPRRAEQPIHKKQMHASSVNAIKKRIRDVKRRLERSDNLPATVRVEDERALAAYEQELAAADEEKARQKMIKRYHMVRFFERQKATRYLKKLRKQLLEANSEEEVATIKAKMHVAEVDLNYTQYFPLSQPYISLYPQKPVGENEMGGRVESIDDTRTKPSMWAEVERRMVGGTLDQLRNGLSDTAVRQGKIASSLPTRLKSKAGSTQGELNGQVNDDAATHSNSVARLEHGLEDQDFELGKRDAANRVHDDQGREDESDGGFFE